MEYEKSCGAVIYRAQAEERQYLLVQNQKPGKPAHWGFPKGHVEIGETEMETALREVLEETALSVQLLPEFRAVSHYSPRPGVEKDAVYFLAKPESEEIVLQETEIAAYGWYNAEEALTRLTHDADANILLQAIEFLNKGAN